MPPDSETENQNLTRIFLCGDVMTGRGIDQILLHPSEPTLFEGYIHNARQYVEIAEEINGTIPRKVSGDYIWGDALVEWQRQVPDLKIINLETSITTSNMHWEGKGIHYRMHPKNIDLLTSAGIDICTLSNNHVLDWGVGGLLETIDVLRKKNIKFAGAGYNRSEAMAPAIFKTTAGQAVLVYSVGLSSSGIPPEWAATHSRPGVCFLSDLSDESIQRIKTDLAMRRKRGDLAILSIHWGSNWGYEIPSYQRAFAHKIIDELEIDIVHGHSSHHPRPIEIYKGRPIFYGCGDFLNDYEGISGFEIFRSDLTLMYFVEFDSNSRKLAALELVPMQIKKFRLHYASAEDSRWLWETLLSKSRFFGTEFSLSDRNTIFKSYA